MRGLECKVRLGRQPVSGAPERNARRRKAAQRNPALL
jgi:hypothetical protein